MQLTIEELKGMRDRKEITPDEFKKRVQKIRSQQQFASPETSSPSIQEPIRNASIKELTDVIQQSAKESEENHKKATLQVEKALLDIVKSLNSKTKAPPCMRVVKFTVERDGNNITAIIPHYEKV